ncbi:MAG: hypothetical protein ACD_52C00179G0001, partial [uncultured bacterium]
DFQIPCRWVPDMGYGFGYPQFSFYAPLVYYIGEAFHLLGMQFIDVLKLLFVTGFILSGAAMYLLAREFMTRFPSLIATLFYVYAPVRAVQVYVRGSLSEFWVAVFLPVVLWAAIKFVRTTDKKYLGYYSLFVGLLVLTHNLLPAFFIGLVVAVVTYYSWREKKLSVLPKFFLGTVLGLGLAAFFLIPLLVEFRFVHADTLLGGYFDYRRHFVSFTQLFFSNTWGYGSSDLGSSDDLALSVGVLHWPIALAGIVLVFLIRKKERLWHIVLPMAVSVLALTFLMHAKSHTIWENLNFLAWLQFPWRFLVLTNFILAFLVGVAIHQLRVFAKVVGVLLIIMVLFFYAPFFAPRDWYTITDNDKFSGDAWVKQLTISIFDYLPISASMPPDRQAPDLPEILEGQAVFSAYKRGSNFQEGVIDSATESLVRVPFFDFPGVTAYIDGEITKYVSDDCRGQKNCLGLVTIRVPEGIHTFKVKLENTPARVLGNVVTLVSVAILVLLFRGKRNDKNQGTN